MKLIIAYIVSAITIASTLLPIVSDAHIIKNSITTTTSFKYNDKKELEVDYYILMPSSELNLVTSIVDKNLNKTIDDDEKNAFLDSFKDKFNVVTFNTVYKPISIQYLNTYDEMNLEVFPTFKLKINFGTVMVGNDYNSFEINNTLLFNTLIPQDWNLSTTDNTNLTFKDTNYAPDPTIPSNKIITQIKSEKGDPNTNIFSKISNFELYNNIRNNLKNTKLEFRDIGWLLLLCAFFGIVHAFQPGHGKAIIGAYLASIKGSWIDSVIMAISTTISHTFIILILSLVWAIFKDGISFIIPLINLNIKISKEIININIAAVWLKNLSSIVLILTGIYMTLRSYKAYIDNKIKSELGDYDELTMDMDGKSDFRILNHGNHKHILPNKRINLRQSIWLGLNTGLTPCFDAMILFTLSISLGLGWLGFWLLLSFSLGLGLSLALIGYGSAKIIGQASRVYSRTEQFAVLLPIISSIVIIIIAIINLLN